jgi:hypothetical protein
MFVWASESALFYTFKLSVKSSNAPVFLFKIATFSLISLNSALLNPSLLLSDCFMFFSLLSDYFFLLSPFSNSLSSFSLSEFTYFFSLSSYSLVLFINYLFSWFYLLSFNISNAFLVEVSFVVSVALFLSPPPDPSFYSSYFKSWSYLFIKFISLMLSKIFF